MRSNRMKQDTAWIIGKYLWNILVDIFALRGGLYEKLHHPQVYEVLEKYLNINYSSIKWELRGEPSNPIQTSKESLMAHRVLLLLSLSAAAVVAAAVDAEDPLIRQVVPGGDDNDLELNAESHFLSFVQRFGKSYKDADEHAYRLSVFKANLRRARRHQLLDPSAEHGVTKFSDLTPAEFRRTYLGLRKSRRALLRELGDSAHDAPVLPTDGLPDDFDWRDHGAVGPVKNQVDFHRFWWWIWWPWIHRSEPLLAWFLDLFGLSSTSKWLLNFFSPAVCLGFVRVVLVVQRVGSARGCALPRYWQTGGAFRAADGRLRPWGEEGNCPFLLPSLNFTIILLLFFLFYVIGSWLLVLRSLDFSFHSPCFVSWCGVVFLFSLSDWAEAHLLWSWSFWRSGRILW